MPKQHVKTSSSLAIAVKWTPVMTENGACFATNTVAIRDVAITKPDWNTTTEWPFKCQFTAVMCYIMFEVTIPTHFYVHSVYDVADSTDHPSTIYPSLNRFTELSVMETRAGDGVRQLSPRRRGCLYTDETEDSRKQVYSTHMCRLSCRSRLAVKLCGCRPFYYFFEGGTVCDTHGMWCLSQHVRELANFGGDRCSCSQQCQDSTFLENFSEDQFWDKGPFQGRGALRLTVQAPRTRYTREIVFHFQDLVVSFGGAAGLFLGASVISFVEIIYFLMETLLRIFTIKEAKHGIEMDPSPGTRGKFALFRIQLK
ncbi:sodium channel protein Nach-like [Leptidea sinapis]|uniref:sodium channel protein Nach-like n=1 Tax=Leptidea sinapis TaxID=189913 RepID=UPI0021C42FFD|nr:sodium channel protein Nach-like [Leptidea sinapis]